MQLINLERHANIYLLGKGQGKMMQIQDGLCITPTLTQTMHLNCSRMCLHNPFSYYLNKQELHATFRICMRRKKVESTKRHDSPTENLFVESSNSCSLLKSHSQYKQRINKNCHLPENSSFNNKSIPYLKMISEIDNGWRIQTILYFEIERRKRLYQI